MPQLPEAQHESKPVSGRLRKAYADGRFGQVHYVYVGTGAPLVLMGPAPRSWTAFERLFPLLEVDFQLIAPDVPGFGQSTVPPPDADMYDLASSILAVLDDRGLERADVYGHNTGRLVAAALAAQAPERVRRLIIAGPTFTLIPEQDARVAAIRSFVKDRYFGDAVGSDQDSDPFRREWATTFRTLAQWWWSDRVFTDPTPAETIHSLTQRIVDELTSREAVRAMYGINFDFDMAEALSRVSAPTLLVEIVGGSADQADFERQGPRLADRMSDARTVTLEQTEDAMALDLLTGMAPMAKVIREFLGGQR
jgi:pimeloyl-ACP methyl ester carboxylesterase